MANRNSYLKTLALTLVMSLLAGPAVALASESPSIVENVKAFPGDGQVTLTWDAATDDKSVEGYYVYAGVEPVETSGTYMFGSTNVGNVGTYTMDNLSNSVTYYFAITAYDEDGNESGEYSNEVEVTPDSSELGDFTAPTVKSVMALTGTLVEVNFSESISLPSDPVSAFALEASDGTGLQILDAYVSDNPSTVFLVTGDQVPGAQYQLTAGIGINDLADNPVESGTSDTAYFTGSALERVEVTTTDVPRDSINVDFELSEVEASQSNELILTFSQAILSADPDSFTIEMLDDASQTVEVLGVSIDLNDASMVTLITGDMEAGYDYLLTIDEMVLNENGEALSEDARSLEFTAKTLDLADEIAPEDITDLLASLSGETSVVLSWTTSVDSAGDLAKYLLYTSTDGGTIFGDSLSLSKDAVQYEVDGLTAGETYTFKVTAMDENGNESIGEMTTVTLPEAGPGMIGIGLLSLLGAGVASRRRKENLE